MKINVNKFIADEGKKIKLKNFPNKVKQYYIDKDDYKRIKEKNLDKLTKLQGLLYSYNKYSLLLIFQGMDASGKDGAIGHVMSGVNPEGCQSFSFKQPSSQDLDHDFIWRIYECLPERGRIGIFNRSYYEEVLIVKVHPEFLEKQNIPEEILNSGNFWKNRYKSIVDIENHLNNNGTKIIKFFLHMSKEEQKERFLARIDEPDKNWKFNSADVKERGHWKDYMKAYEDCISNTSTKFAPWYIIPADDKENARLIISKIIIETLEKLKLFYPATDDNRRKELQEIREELVKS